MYVDVVSYLWKRKSVSWRIGTTCINEEEIQYSNDKTNYFSVQSASALDQNSSSISIKQIIFLPSLTILEGSFDKHPLAFIRTLICLIPYFLD